MESNIWLTRKEAERLTGLPERTIQWYCKAGKWRVQEVPSEFGSAKKQYLIDLASLPDKAQLKWVEENLERAIELPEVYVRELCFEAASTVLRAKANAKGGELSDLVLFNKQDKARKLVEMCEKASKVPFGKNKSQWIREIADYYGTLVKKIVSVA